MCIALVTFAGVSFRAVSKIFVCINLYLNLNIGNPTHTTVLNWIKKQGISNFKEKEFYIREKWVLIVDESIQFGNKKLLLVLAVPESRCREGRALSYSDLTPLVLKVGASWKSKDITSEIRRHINLKQVSYCISDGGNNLTHTYRTLKWKYIPDINHKFSLIVQSVFEKDPLFVDFTKSLSLLRGQKSMSKIARIVSPNQRIISRFMNLTPLFMWGAKMLVLLDKNQLTPEEEAALSFLRPNRAFIFDTCRLLLTMNKIQKLLKNKGYNVETAREALSFFSGMNGSNVLKIKKQIENYFADLSSKTKKGTTICCSSDIIESCFGKYKEIVRGNKTVGISDLCLCIAAMTGSKNLDGTNCAMETVNMRQVKDWKNKNVSKTLFAEKQELNMKVERYFN